MVSSRAVPGPALPRASGPPTPPGAPVQAGVQGERPLLGGLPRAVHGHAQLLAGRLVGVLHHQGVAAGLRHRHLQLDVHLGGGAIRGPCPSPRRTGAHVDTAARCQGPSSPDTAAALPLASPAHPRPPAEPSGGTSDPCGLSVSQRAGDRAPRVSWLPTPAPRPCPSHSCPAPVSRLPGQGHPSPQVSTPGTRTSLPRQRASGGCVGLSCSVGHGRGRLLSCRHRAPGPGAEGKPSRGRWA